MKPLGFLISFLVHLLFLLLISMAQFPLIELNMKPQIIQVVPMFPSLTVRQPLPAAVYVRPFVLKGGARARTGLPSTPVSKGGGAAAAARPLPGDPGGAAAAAPGSGMPDAIGKRSKLTVNLDRVAQRLRERKTTGEQPGDPGFATDQEGEGLPFGDPPAGRGDVSPSGDGTSSHALGGHAFFDSRGYDITPWARRMVYRVKRNWIFPPVSEFGLKGVVGIYLLIGREGAIASIHIRKTSGIRPLDQAAFNAIELSAPLPPLPSDFPHEALPAYLLFYYN